MGTPKTARLAFYTGSGKRIGFGKRGRRIFYTHPVPVPGGRDYAAIEKAALLAPLGIGVSPAIPELYNSQTELREAKEILAKFNVVHHGKVVAFSPVSRRLYKQWPLSCFAQVCDALNEKYDLKFLPLFGPGEEKAVQSVIDLSKRKAAFLFPYSVSTFGRVKPLIEACLFYLGNDNGIRHAAVLCGVPTATVFGVHADPYRWTPAGDGRHQYIWGKEGIDTVEPETVIRMVDRLIEKKLLYEKAQQTV
jgi:ADP-heptose:LPS heptosyltransferase